MSIVVTETAAPGIARIAINRPDKRNAVSPEARNALIEAVAAALSDSAVRAIVLGSTEGAFLRRRRYRLDDGFGRRLGPHPNEGQPPHGPRARRGRKADRRSY